jgi:hypothetical protein
MALKVILAKTGDGSAPAVDMSTVGLNSNRIPAADGADAKGLTIFVGRHADEPIEVIFTKNAQDGTFYFEGSQDGTTFSRIEFRDTLAGADIPGSGLVLSATTRLIVRPLVLHRLVALRCGFFLAAADAANPPKIVVQFYEGR